jgi:GNAT superfamily N-acetyltransferase
MVKMFAEGATVYERKSGNSKYEKFTKILKFLNVWVVKQTWKRFSVMRAMGIVVLAVHDAATSLGIGKAVLQRLWDVCEERG